MLSSTQELRGSQNVGLPGLSAEQPLKVLLEFLLDYGQHYLACGGPVSRLEDRIVALAQGCGAQVQIFATPTFLVLSLSQEAHALPSTFMRKISSQSLNLARLKRLERIADRLILGKLDLAHGYRLLRYETKSSPNYPQTVLWFASFLIGFSVTYPIRLSLGSAVQSGLMCLALQFLFPLLSQRYRMQAFLLEFLACFLALALSALGASFLGTAFHEAALGVLVTLVPGLSLTVAISEVTGGHVVSGLMRLTRTFLTLLSMGLAWILIAEGKRIFSLDLMPAGSLSPHPWISKDAQNLLWYSSLLLLIFCFAIFFHVPRRLLIYLLPVGLLGLWMYQGLGGSPAGVLPSFCASFSIGLASGGLARWLRVPSQIFSTPCILILVPGLLAFSSFQSVDSSVAVVSASSNPILRAFLTASAIVFGLVLSRMLFGRQQSDTAV